MLVRCDARSYVSRAELIRAYCDTRRRLFGRPKPAPRLAPEAPALPPEPLPAPSPVTLPAVQVDEIIDTICARVTLTRAELLTDISAPRAVLARKVAAALTVVRLQATAASVAEHFGINQNAVSDGLMLIARPLRARAVPRDAPLQSVVALLAVECLAGCDQQYVTAKDVIDATCAAYGLRQIDFLSRCRTLNYVRPRQLAVALTRHLTHLSMPQIGKSFLGRDHTTILHAVRLMAPIINAVAPTMPNGAGVSEWVAACRPHLEAMSWRLPPEFYRPATSVQESAALAGART